MNTTLRMQIKRVFFNPYTSPLILFLLFVFGLACTHTQAIIDAFHHRYFIGEPDAYMHMVIALDVLKTHDWSQHFSYRINAPFGADTHAWTQVVNAVLVGGSLLLGFFMPVTTALYAWSFTLPILVNAFAACAMLWTIKPFNPTCFQQIFIAAAFLLNPIVGALFEPLRVDYDFLLIFLSVVYWGSLFRLISTHKTCWVIATSIIAALGIWTSISFILLVLVSLAFIVGSCLYKTREHISVLKAFLVVLCLAMSLSIAVEHHLFFMVSYDLVSVVYVTFFLLLLLSLDLYTRYLSSLHCAAKLFWVMVLMVFDFFIMNTLFPGVYNGPYNHVDPYVLQYFFPYVDEFLSPFKIDNALVLALLLYCITGAGYCYYLYLDRPQNEKKTCNYLHPPSSRVPRGISKLKHWTTIQKIPRGTRDDGRAVTKTLFFSSEAKDYQVSLLLWGTLILTGFALYMQRWEAFSVPPAILLASFFVAQLCNINMNIVYKIGIVCVMAGLPSVLLLNKQHQTPDISAPCQQQLHTMIHDGFLDKPQFQHDKIMFIHSDDGPLILYATHYSIIGTNDHHNPEGLKESLQFSKEDEVSVKHRMMQRKIDLILLCHGRDRTAFDIEVSDWLHQIPLPEHYSRWHLYRTSRGT